MNVLQLAVSTKNMSAFPPCFTYQRIEVYAVEVVLPQLHAFFRRVVRIRLPREAKRNARSWSIASTVHKNYIHPLVEDAVKKNAIIRTKDENS